jgi:sulfur relay (sulfurtransferase) complex TusBCD TusD component (DsrE family)
MLSNSKITKKSQNKELNKILLLITKPPFTSQESYRAYQLAEFLSGEGYNPILFHFMDGIYNLSDLPSHTLNFQNNKKILRDLIKKGIKVIACSRCLIARGFWDEKSSTLDDKVIIPSNTLEGVEVKGIQQLLLFINLGYKVIKF